MVDSLNNSQMVVMVVVPIIIFLLYRLMVSGINNSSILDIAVYDLGSSRLVTTMQQNPELVLHVVTSETTLQERINEGEMSGLHIPADFDEAVTAGENPELTIWLNPQRGLQSETLAWQRFIEAEILNLGQQQLPAQIEWMEVDNGSPFDTGTGLDSYLLVIILTLILFMTGANVVATLITEEKEKKTAVMLTTSPAQINDIVWGKTLVGTFYIVVITAVIILINGGLTGNRPLALLYMGLGVPVAISVGILMGSMTQSTKQCSGWLSLVMMFLLIPSWFLTLINLPEPYSSIIHVIPTHFMVQGLSDALNHVSVTASNTLNLTVWAIFTVAMVAITAWRVHHKPQSIIA
jgi:ABC-type transport system involved in multi-copper enzyme maturation permease subunit